MAQTKHMGVITLRQVPWTCLWGRFVGSPDARIAGPQSLWGCHRDAHATTPPSLHIGECERCPHWEPAADRRG